MLPVVAIVGRPNVGKSTLFNVLTRTRDALVADEPGLTRDRKYGYGRVGPMPYIAIDTGGLLEKPGALEQLMAEQAELAITEADRVVLLVDARSGLTPDDEFIARTLRRAGKPVVLTVNKAEGREPETAALEFHALGLGEPIAISAAHLIGIDALMDVVLAGLTFEPPAVDDRRAIHVAVVGRPNVGKSTLINRFLGEERLVAFDQPGTTRDAIFVPFERDGRSYMLIDTAGVRRKARVEEKVEKFSIVKTLQAIDEANVVIGIIDAQEGVTEQDATLFGTVVERGRSLVIAINKWDKLPTDQRDNVRRELDLRLAFLEFAPRHFISARHGSGVGELLGAVDRAHAASIREMPTTELTRLLEGAVIAHQPPLVRGRRIKLRYAHQGGRNPPIIIVHGNQTPSVPDAYRRYLENVFRKAYDLVGAPVRVEFRTDDNPYAIKQRPSVAKSKSKVKEKADARRGRQRR
ncbi:MAG TPA: ribosome biogenesis GTPase Der [Steroidobacteraceae bacterium]|nr:ribosome biogenesis GTPase Der [Steroidobacteraceae bacterium]